MADSTQPPAGDVEAREAAVSTALDTVGPTTRRYCSEWLALAINAAIDTYLAKLTSTKAEPSRIAEIREQHARDEATFTKHPSVSGSLERWLRSTHEALGKALSHITAIEADRDRMREALEKIACWGVRFPEESQGYGVHALMTAREACPEPAALKSSKPGEG